MISNIQAKAEAKADAATPDASDVTGSVSQPVPAAPEDQQ